jgi:hypothetical protein
MSRFLVLRDRTHFRRYRGRLVPFSCFAPPDSFSTETRVSGIVFMFCLPGVVSRGTKGVGSRFQILRSPTRFRRYRGNRVPFSCFALPNMFSAVPMASGPVCMCCAPGLIFGSIEGIHTRFHILRAPSRFRHYRERRVPFSCFARLDSFSAETRVPGTVFMFCAPEVFLMVPRASCPVF